MEGGEKYCVQHFHYFNAFHSCHYFENDEQVENVHKITLILDIQCLKSTNLPVSG